MAEDSSNSTNIPLVVSSAIPLVSNSTLISINAASQIPIKLTPSNYPSWRAQFHSLLLGYDLIGFIDGSFSCPQKTTTSSTDASVPNPTYTYWIRQDQLLLHAIIASVSETVLPLIASSTTSKEAWERLIKLYANKSRSRAMHLKEKLTLFRRESRSVSEYLQGLKSISDELCLIDHPISEDDLIIHVLNGLGSEFKEIAVAIRARESPISFEELHDKLVEHENFLKREDAHNEVSIISANHTRRSNGSNTNRGNKTYPNRNPNSARSFGLQSRNNSNQHMYQRRRQGQ